MRKHLFRLIACAIFIGCETRNAEKQPEVKDDTTKVLLSLFNEDFLKRNMAGYGAVGVGQPGIFGDTILLQYNDSLDKYIPKSFANHFLKRITKDSLCRLVKQFVEVLDFPEFLELLSFEKNDSGYTVMLRATCVFPDYFENDVDTSKTCVFGLLCGGGFAVSAVENADTFILKRLGAWSD